MQDRSARIRYQDIVTDSSPLQCGLPQGSPVSPILFLLYTEPIYRLGHSQGRFGYADDTAILCVGNSLDETTAEASHHETDEHETWPSAECYATSRLRLRHPRATVRGGGLVPWSEKPALDEAFQEGPSGIGNLVKKMSKALYTSLRAILPVWRTTPTNVLHREAGIPPVPLLLEGRRTAFAARLKALDEAHPLVSARRDQKLPLRRADEMLSSCPRPALLQRGFAEEQTAPLQSASKHETAKKFRDWLQALSPRTLVVYSDGSRSEEGHIGYGYAVHRDGSTVLSGRAVLEQLRFSTLRRKVHWRLKAAVSLPETDRIFVCLDNLATATCLQGTPNDSSQEVFLEFQSLARKYGAVEVHWIPGHADIPGNEEADALARREHHCQNPLMANRR
ncbi:reverse transcriptase (RNA-dependent DNA polymerase) [Hirsutella rhossiliensis]